MIFLHKMWEKCCQSVFSMTVYHQKCTVKHQWAAVSGSENKDPAVFLIKPCFLRILLCHCRPSHTTVALVIISLRALSWPVQDPAEVSKPTPFTSWGCRTVPEESPGRRWGWRSAGSWPCWPRPPSSAGSPPPSAAASPAWKTSGSLCPGAPPCGYCSALPGIKPHLLSKLEVRMRPVSHQHCSPETNQSNTRDETGKINSC